MNIRVLREHGAKSVLSAIAAHQPQALGFPDDANTAMAPRAAWRFALIESPRGMFAIGERGRDDERWFEWRADALIEHRKTVEPFAEAPPRTGRWRDDAVAFVDAIRAHTDVGPWLRWESGPSPFDDTSLHVHTYVGRHADCDVVVMDRLLSKQHLSFHFQATARQASRRDWIFGAPHHEPTPSESRASDGVWIEDHNTINGTFLRDARVTRQRIADGDVFRAGNTEMSVHFERPSRRPRAHADAWRDDAVWDGLFLDRMLLKEPNDVALPKPEPLFAKLGGLREGSRATTSASDTRWVFSARDEAEVFFDALVDRGAPGLRAMPPPLVGDASMRWGTVAEAPEDLVLLRLGRVVARLYVKTAWYGWSIDDLAARVVTRVAASRLG